MTYKEAYEYGKHILLECSVVDGTLDARLLLEYVCHTARHDLLVHGERNITNQEEMTYKEFIERRSNHIPLQYITGEQEFMGLRFKVDENVLIPRQDTEFLVEEAMLHIHDGMEVLDLCTGSGCILLSVLSYKNNCKGVGVDLSEKALAVAKENAASLHIDATFLHSDLCSNVEGMFDVVVSNPPYIPTDVIPELMEEVQLHEPMMALDGKEDGLYFYRKITNDVKKHLKKGAYLLFEIGHDQGQQVKHLMEESSYCDVEVKKDYAGNDRVVLGWYRA